MSVASVIEYDGRQSVNFYPAITLLKHHRPTYLDVG